MSAELLLCCLTLKVPKTCLWAGIEVLTRDSFPHQLVLTMLRALRLTMAVPVWEEKAKGISAEQQLPEAQKRPMEEMAVPWGLWAQRWADPCMQQGCGAEGDGEELADYEALLTHHSLHSPCAVQGGGGRRRWMGGEGVFVFSFVCFSLL